MTAPGHRVIGRHVLRRQDPALLTGRGLYVADVQRPGMLHMAVLRSQYAHARIVRVDAAACATAPGVVLTLTAQDLAGVAKPLPVLRQGTNIMLPGHTLAVLRECSGVNQLIALTAMVLPAAYLWLPTVTRRAAIIAIGVTVICFGAVFYVFFWGRIPWLPPRKK